MDAPRTQPVDSRVLVDVDRCIECQSCAAACYYSHANMPAVGFAGAGWALLPVICRQCKAAPCVDACPQDAMVIDGQGVVRLLPMRCIGCSSCVKACPFGVLADELASGRPGLDGGTRGLNGRLVGKCDLCADRTERDAQAQPRCVSACPSGALTFADERQAEQLGICVLGGRAIGEHPYKRR